MALNNYSFITLVVLLFLALGLRAQSSYYSFDGSGNNLKNPDWGKLGTAQLRRINQFADKQRIPTGGNPSRLPSTRFISNTVFNRVLTGSRPESTKATALLTYFGQFVDHDITSTPGSSPCEAFPIPIPKGDLIYDPTSRGNVTMSFCRSAPLPNTGNDTTNPRNYANNMNGFLDASVIYGLDVVTSNSLRQKTGGLLKTSSGPDGELLPINNNGTDGPLVRMANGGPFPTTSLFAAGEGRANVSPMLACLHTLFFREHNRRARSLPSSMSDDQKFNKARRLTTAVYQQIVMYEYIPSLLGENPPAYKGYNESLNPQTDIFFSTVAFRVGHDQLASILERVDVNGKTIPEGNVLVRDGFFNPTFIKQSGIGPFIRGSVSHSQEKIDAMIIDDVRNFLFGQVPTTATDLAARNIQRARDHGLGTYNDARRAYGLTPCETFSCVTSDPAAIEALNKAYGTDNVTFLDPYVGALIENKRPNSLVGDLLYRSILDQFVRYRDGDRFWFENKGVLTSDELKEVKSTTLCDIITRNTNSKNMPPKVFARTGLTASQIYSPSSDTNYMIAIIIVSTVCAILIIVIVGLCFTNKKNVDNGNLYNPLVEKD